MKRMPILVKGWQRFVWRMRIILIADLPKSTQYLVMIFCKTAINISCIESIVFISEYRPGFFARDSTFCSIASTTFITPLEESSRIYSNIFWSCVFALSPQTIANICSSILQSFLSFVEENKILLNLSIVFAYCAAKFWYKSISTSFAQCSKQFFITSKRELFWVLLRCGASNCFYKYTKKHQRKSSVGVHSSFY